MRYIKQKVRIEIKSFGLNEKHESNRCQWFTFYALKRGHHPNSTGGFTSTNDLAFLNHTQLDYIYTIESTEFRLINWRISLNQI